VGEYCGEPNRGQIAEIVKVFLRNSAEFDFLKNQNGAIKNLRENPLVRCE